MFLYWAIPQTVLFGMLWCFLKPGVVSAQSDTGDLCNALTQAVSTAYSDLEPSSPANLAFIVSTSHRARECYGATHFERKVWLLNKEVWGLDGLKRYREARELVDLFYERYFEAASDEYKARFALHRLRLSSFQGNFIDAAISYQQGLQYAHALPRERRISMYLDGAYLYHEAGQYEQAARIAEQVIKMGGSDEDLALVYARALFVRSEARLRQESRKAKSDRLLLDQVVKDLETAAGRFRALDALDRQAVALAVLGEAYGEISEDTLAMTRLDEALRVANEDENAKSKIFVLLSRGRVSMKRQAYDQAESDFTTALALADSSGVGKYTSDLLLELGKVYEQQNKLDEAEAHLRLAGTRPHSVFTEDSFRIAATKRQAQAHLVRVMSQHRHQLNNRWLILFLITMFLLVTSVGYSLWQRRLLCREREEQQHRSRPTLPPDPLPVRRLAYMKAVFDDPDKVAVLIREEQPHQARRLEKGMLRRRSDLYLCVAALERVIEGRELHSPDDAVHMDLYRYFKKQKWTWPQSIEAWRQHIETHPPEVSLELSK